MNARLIKLNGEIVAEVVPLKQGLKHFLPSIMNDLPSGCRDSSIKARVETQLQ